MTVKFYVADGLILAVPPEDADWVKYEDYKRLEIAARKVLACLNMYKDIGIVTFTSEAIDDLKKELEG